MESIRYVEFRDSWKNDNDATKLLIGCAICEFCVSMIIPCDETLVSAVKCNLDVTNKVDRISKKRTALTNASFVKRQSNVTVYRPVMPVFHTRIEQLLIGKKKFC